MKMTVQEAADQLLREVGEPRPSRELAQVMHGAGLVSSQSKDPVFSLATSLEKNIRDGRYNRPALKFVYPGGRRDRGTRLISLAEWPDPEPAAASGRASYNGRPAEVAASCKLEARIPAELMAKIERATTIGFGETSDVVVTRVLERGFDALSEELQTRLNQWVAETRF